MTAPTIHTDDTAKDNAKIAPFLAPQNNQGADEYKPVQCISLTKFRTVAVAKQLIDHGRAFEVFVGGHSLGFADGDEQAAVTQAHRREVNNALWSFEQGLTLDPLLAMTLPTREALQAYPDLRERFPAAAARVDALAGLAVDATGDTQ